MPAGVLRGFIPPVQQRRADSSGKPAGIGALPLPGNLNLDRLMIRIPEIKIHRGNTDKLYVWGKDEEPRPQSSGVSSFEKKKSYGLFSFYTGGLLPRHHWRRN
jgi:hypothetical protein